MSFRASPPSSRDPSPGSSCSDDDDEILRVIRAEIARDDASGAGEVTRDTSWVDLDASYLVSDRVAVMFGLWRNDLGQSGEFVVDEGVPDRGAWDLGTTGFEGGLSYAVAAAASVHCSVFGLSAAGASPFALRREQGM